MRPTPLRIAALVCFVSLVAASGAEPPSDPAHEAAARPSFSAEQLAFFEEQVRPILAAKCLKCHGDEEKIASNFYLTSRAAVLRGGDLGPAVDLNDVAASQLVEAINYGGLEMPPSGKLPQAEIDVLTQWVKEGLPWTPGTEKEPPPTLEVKTGVTDEDRAYWAYQPVRRPEVPEVKNTTWVRTPIDAFILAKLEAAGIEPSPEADPRELLRRATYDLTGLPPTPEEADEFYKAATVGRGLLPHRDQRSRLYTDASAALIDALLASPHYGEKWGRHWLDLVRYAETHGFERDAAKPFAWRYRDYVIDAFNEDKPYDDFLREQLAGDELEEVTAESLIATGYYRLGIWDDEPADRDLATYDVLDGISATTSSVMLGMSMGCARCHTHKKDPIPHRDYYRLLAFFRDVTEMNKTNLQRFASAKDRRDYEAAVAEKSRREAEWYSQLYPIEQQFLAAAAEQGLELGEVRGADLAELRYRFYRDTWKELPDFDTLKPESSGTSTNRYFSLSPATRQEAFGLVYEGKLKVPESGLYEFQITSREGIRLIIDGRRVVDRPRTGVHHVRADVRLEAGFIPVRLEYFNAAQASELRIAWSGPSFQDRPLSDGAKPGQSERPNKNKRGDDDPQSIEAIVERHGETVLGRLLATKYHAILAQLEDSRRQTIAEPGLDVMCVVERGSTPTHVLLRGLPGAPGEAVSAGVPEVLAPAGYELPGFQAAASSSGKRRALAEWIVDPQNPATARVLVNRVWQYHFGRGLVATPNDFGKLGESPSHPELLDWLADEFVRGGRRIKPLHRLIMSSSVYRQSSRSELAAGLAPRSPANSALQIDPDNRLLWHFAPRRLSAEEVRDSILAVSGKLDLRVGGPSVYPPIPAAVLAGQSRPGEGWPVSSEPDANRRSVYVHVKRSLLVPILSMHDQADTDGSCAVRFTTTVPTQALGMLNGAFVQEQAATLAERLMREAPKSLEDRIRRAVALTTLRTATDDEVARDADFVHRAQSEGKLSDADALKLYCLLVLNANEFFYVD